MINLANKFRVFTGGQSKEEVIETNERLRAVRIRLDDSYDTAKKALVNLMARYGDSKAQRNVFQRYNLLKIMIKVKRKSSSRIPFTENRKRPVKETVRIHKSFSSS